jgi:hypothetical protein
MVKKTLVLENHRGVMERKLVHQHQQGSSSKPRIGRLQQDLCSGILSHSFNRGPRKEGKDLLPHNVK